MKSFCQLVVASLLTATALGAAAECNPTLRNTFDASAVTAESNGVLVDSKTGLMWMRCALGYQWQSGNCVRDESQTAEFTWPDALKAAAEAKAFAGYQDWRLPNRKELASIVEAACHDPAINLTLFPATEAKGYWSSSPNNFAEVLAWGINFTNGDHISTSRTNLFGVRLVREVKP
ncbi:MAG: DUF1566 domain-containing protein [Cellvibrionaceae bacterium]|nr:DUF1566 domain-containing protein [Cellvibrionaceae bacterium]